MVFVFVLICWCFDLQTRSRRFTVFCFGGVTHASIHTQEDWNKQTFMNIQTHKQTNKQTNLYALKERYKMRERESWPIISLFHIHFTVRVICRVGVHFFANLECQNRQTNATFRQFVCSFVCLFVRLFVCSFVCVVLI